MNTIVTTITTQINSILQNITTDMLIKDPYWITYSLPYAPTSQNNFISAGVNAYIYLTGKKVPPPFNPPPIPLINLTNTKDVQFILGDYIINSGIYAAYK